MQGWIYIVQMEGYPWLRIGQTTQAPRSRLDNLQSGTPLLLSLVREYPCDAPGNVELLMRRMLKDSSYRRDWFNTDIVVIDVAFQLAVDIGNDPSLWHTPEQLLSYKAFGKNMKWDASNDGSIVWRDGVWVETSLSDEERITLWHQQFDGALQRSQKEFYALSLSRVQPSYIHEAFARALERLQQRAEYLRGIQY